MLTSSCALLLDSFVRCRLAWYVMVKKEKNENKSRRKSWNFLFCAVVSGGIMLDAVLSVEVMWW